MVEPISHFEVGKSEVTDTGRASPVTGDLRVDNSFYWNIPSVSPSTIGLRR